MLKCDFNNIAVQLYWNRTSALALLQHWCCFALGGCFWVSQKPLIVAAAKKSFPSVFIVDTTCFDECFLLYVTTGNSTFYTNLMLPRSLVPPPCCCILWNKSAFYVTYLHNNIKMMLIAKIQIKASTFQIFWKKLPIMFHIFLNKWNF